MIDIRQQEKKFLSYCNDRLATLINQGNLTDLFRVKALSKTKGLKVITIETDYGFEVNNETYFVIADQVGNSTALVDVCKKLKEFGYIFITISHEHGMIHDVAKYSVKLKEDTEEAFKESLSDCLRFLMSPDE